jgi:hypothetical protein
VTQDTGAQPVPVLEWAGGIRYRYPEATKAIVSFSTTQRIASSFRGWALQIAGCRGGGQWQCVLLWASRAQAVAISLVIGYELSPWPIAGRGRAAANTAPPHF